MRRIIPNQSAAILAQTIGMVQENHEATSEEYTGGSPNEVHSMDVQMSRQVYRRLQREAVKPTVMMISPTNWYEGADPHENRPKQSHPTNPKRRK